MPTDAPTADPRAAAIDRLLAGAPDDAAAAWLRALLERGDRGGSPPPARPHGSRWKSSVSEPPSS
jgi:hypothetical protein